MEPTPGAQTEEKGDGKREREKKKNRVGGGGEREMDPKNLGPDNT